MNQRVNSELPSVSLLAEAWRFSETTSRGHAQRSVRDSRTGGAQPEGIVRSVVQYCPLTGSAGAFDCSPLGSRFDW
jgi:hypothetical protein